MSVNASLTADPGAANSVDTALAAVEVAAALPLDEQPDAFQAIHETLRAALAEIDDA